LELNILKRAELLYGMVYATTKRVIFYDKWLWVMKRYYDPKSTLDNPRWTGVDVTFGEIWDTMISLGQLRDIPELADLALVRRGNRLSLMPVSTEQWQAILRKHQQD
jgi:predicted RNA-binding protein with PUA-like domain